MRQLFLTFIICVFAFAKATPQEEQMTDSVQKTVQPTAVEAVQKFFDHFHNQDKVALSDAMADDLVLRSFSISSKGNKLSSMTKQEFVSAIIQIPDSIAFEEKLIEIKVLEDEHIANVFTTYEFYYDGKFTHNGTNSFTLIFMDDKWIITGITDTRLYP